MKVCISCKRSIANDPLATTFFCPKCGQVEIMRCGICRKTGTLYKCPKCGFEGP